MKRQTRVAKSVVLIGERIDAHLPFVERHLSVPLIVVGADSMIAGEELSYSLHKKKLRIIYNGQPLDSVAGVWLRGRRTPGPLKIPVSPAYQEYARSAALRQIEALYAHLEGARWVSDYYAMRRAGYKPLQLQTAARLGFHIPETLFTSSPTRAKEFVDSHPATITKPIAHERPQHSKKNLRFTFFATKIHKREEVDLLGLSVAPAIFQQAIDVEADLRAIVMGDKIFSAIIIDQEVDSNSAVRDWRVGHYKGRLSIEPYKLPKAIADKCIALVKELGLQYGALDLILDKKGKIWFIENNTNGQWAFIEEVTGQPMGKAMADLLQG